MLIKKPQLRHVDVAAEQVRFLYRNGLTGVIVNVVLALLLVVVLWSAVPRYILLIWLLCSLSLSVARLYHFWLFAKKDPPDEAMHKWRRAFFITATASGLVWGMTIWIFGPYPDYNTPIILAFVLGGLMAGAAAILGAVIQVYLVYAVVIMGPIVSWFVVQMTTEQTVMGMMLLVAMLALLANGVIYRRALVNSIELANDVIEAKEHAEQASQAKTQFLSRMSHELRTPLSAIMGFTQILQEEHKKETTSWEYLDEIVKATDHLLVLIDDLLDIARIEARKVELNMQSVNCADIVQDCLELIQVPLAKKNIKITFKPLNLPVVQVYADRLRLKQVLLNLLSNACKYNVQHGHIAVDWVIRDDDWVRLCVHDSGRGIAPEHEDKIFLSFHRLGQETSAVEGTGLGLMITKQLIEQMGGSIDFDRNLNYGTSFWIELPRVEVPVNPEMYSMPPPNNP